MRNMKSQLGNLLISQIGLLCQGIAPVLSRYMQTDGDHDKRIEEDTQINWSESVYMYKCNISFLVPCVSSSDVINSRHLIKESISVVGQYVWSDFFFFVQRKTPRKYSMTVASCLITQCYNAVTIANMTGWMSMGMAKKKKRVFGSWWTPSGQPMQLGKCYAHEYKYQDFLLRFP